MRSQQTLSFSPNQKAPQKWRLYEALKFEDLVGVSFADEAAFRVLALSDRLAGSDKRDEPI